MSDEPAAITRVEDLPEVHRREIGQAIKEEGRLLRAELIILLLLAAFGVVRQLWLV